MGDIDDEKELELEEVVKETQEEKKDDCGRKKCKREGLEEENS